MTPISRKIRTLVRRLRRWSWGLVAGAMLLAAALALPSLDNHRFWDDEANTAIYARNLLRFGRITAWDGTNLSGYGHGGALGEDLGPGDSVCPPCRPTWPRRPCGCWARRPLRVASRSSWRESPRSDCWPCGCGGTWDADSPVYLPAGLLAASPAFLLYIRNCRYYALAVLFTLAVYCFSAPGAAGSGRCSGPLLRRRESARWAGAAAALLLLAWSQYLNAAILLATLPLWFLDRRYRQGRQYLLMAVLWATGAVYAVWVFVAIGPQGAIYGEGQQWLFARSLSRMHGTGSGKISGGSCGTSARTSSFHGWWSRCCRCHS